MTDEGLNGVDIHIANDQPSPREARLRVALYRNGELKTSESERLISIPEHSTLTFGVEQIFGRFVDAACAYRFGPAGHDLIAASLRTERGDVPFAQAFRFPTGRSAQRCPIAELDITAEPRVRDDGIIDVLLAARRFAYGVRASAPGWLPDDAYFGIEPGAKRRIVLRPLSLCEAPASLTITAINAEGRLSIPIARRA
jgi:beta-mannosidase